MSCEHSTMRFFLLFTSDPLKSISKKNEIRLAPHIFPSGLGYNGNNSASASLYAIWVSWDWDSQFFFYFLLLLISLSLFLVIGLANCSLSLCRCEVLCSWKSGFSSNYSISFLLLVNSKYRKRRNAPRLSCFGWTNPTSPFMSSFFEEDSLFLFWGEKNYL